MLAISIRRKQAAVFFPGPPGAAGLGDRDEQRLTEKPETCQRFITRCFISDAATSLDETGLPLQAPHDPSSSPI